MPEKGNAGWQGQRRRAPPRCFAPDRTPDRFFRHTFLKNRQRLAA